MESLISRLDQALNGQNKLTIVLDIDSTLFNVSPRNQAIFDLFCSIYGLKHDLLPKLSSNYRLSAKDWGLAPYTNLIKDNEELKKSAVSFWKTHFFAGTFLESDRPYPSVIELIKLLHKKGAVVMYLTGRDDFRMRAGTLDQLKHWNLPLEKDSDLITKPHKGMNDGSYKRDALLKISKDFPSSKVMFFDNEPAVLEHCLFPEDKNYTPVFIDSTHSSRSKPHSDWITVNAFEYEKILLRLKKNEVT